MRGVKKSVRVDATVANDDGRAGTVNERRVVDDAAVHDHTVSVPADATIETPFEVTFRDSGPYGLAVENLDSTTITGTENGTYRFEGVTVESDEPTTLDVALNSSVDPTPNGSLSFADQTTAGSNVTVESVTFEDDGFVAIRDASGEVLGFSSHLTIGTHENLSVSLDTSLDSDQNPTAVAHRDMDGNESLDYDGTDATLDDFMALASPA